MYSRALTLEPLLQEGPSCFRQGPFALFYLFLLAPADPGSRGDLIKDSVKQVVCLLFDYLSPSFTGNSKAPLLILSFHLPEVVTRVMLLP